MKTTDLTIAEPCHVSWESMSGDERRRFCAQCSKHVTHLSKLTQREAKDFLLDNPGECVQVDVLGDEVLFEPTPRASMTFRRGWLKRAAAMGAVLAVSTPAFAAGHVAETPSIVTRAVDFVRSLIGAEEVVEEVKVEPEVKEVKPVPDPVERRQVRPLGGAPRPSPEYLDKIAAERARQGK